MTSDSSATGATSGEDGPGGEQGLGVFPVVGIGASAGGLEALTALLRAVQFDGMAFVVIQHRSHQHESLLVELLARSTPMTVLEITDGVVVEPNHVYLAPAGSQVALLGRALRLVQSPTRLPIDFFFRSIAEELGGHAIGIVLSGMGSDGTFGLQAIKEHGGICLVQSLETAKFDGMPRSAIETGVVDAALAPEALAAELASIGQHPYLRPGPRPSPAGMHKLYVLLRDAFGHDLSGYKENTIQRRVERRMAVQRIDKLDDYLRLVHARPEELGTLYRDLLINVTSFFRDAATFEYLEKTILPRIVERKKPGESVRVWVPACSTGEETYSIAMCLLEVLGASASDLPVQIFGTDIDSEAIGRARRGFYPPNIEGDVSPERLARFFVNMNGGYQVGRRVRDLVVFSTQDVAKDAPFSRMDLVSCRNMLIYMQAPLQKRVLATLHYALRPDGFLVLGTSESVGDAADLFSIVDRKTKIYEKKAITTAAALYSLGTRPGAAGVAAARATPMDRRPVVSAQQLADHRILDHYAPPSVLVTEDLDVLLFRGDTGVYVAPASGAATLNVMRLVRPELHLALWHALEKARKEDVRARQPPIRFETRVGDSVATHNVSIEVEPLRLPDAQGRCLLIVFHELDGGAEGVTDVASRASPPGPVTLEEERVRALEQELAATKEFLQSTIEELESSNEELKSTNEELQSANEELQSTNEELETSKEELQSTNEELTTVNDELQRRLTDLARRDSDLNNFLRSTRDPMLFVDAAGRLRHFSAAAAELFGLGPADLGGAIDGLRSRLGPKLDRVLVRCVERIAPATEEILAFDNRWYAMTARPYANAQGTLDGALVTLVDIDATKRSGERRLDVSAYAEKVLPAILHPLVMLDEQHRVLWVNAAFLATFEVDADSTLGNLFHNLGTGQWAHPKLREHIEEVLRSGQPFRDFVIEHDFEPAGKRRMKISGSRVKDISDGGPVALLSIVDVTPPSADGGGRATS
jgi:two-component system, chemotaxis family, CheB/CheR fusion protein